MNNPTPEQIKKLPKWAQDHISKVERERDVCVRELNEWCDNQTVSPVSIREYLCTGEMQGPSSKIRYIQTRRLEIKWEGIALIIFLAPKQDPQRHPGIELQWSSVKEGEVAFIPKGWQTAELVAPENMRVR